MGHCEGGGDPLSLYSLSKTNGSECWQNKQHNVSSDTSIFLGCHRWVSVTGGNNWVFTRRHFECAMKYQSSLGILGLDGISSIHLTNSAHLYFHSLDRNAIWLPYTGENNICLPWEGYRGLATYMSWSTNRCQASLIQYAIVSRAQIWEWSSKIFLIFEHLRG